MTNKQISEKYPAIAGYEKNAYILVRKMEKSHLMKRYKNSMITIDDKYFEDEKVKILFVLKDGSILNDYFLGKYFKDNGLEIDLCGETLGTYIIRKSIKCTLDYIVIIKEGYNSKINKDWKDIIIYKFDKQILSL